ncbi:hypothetical protein OYC64_003047 [Pagothenia borchgrevinki]|uniref:C-type lectin domain-containing protein n=1 Tax=Pagothenia borchgrevinki TaxID=8213 RepID=A0ABD2HC13_PAGBO
MQWSLFVLILMGQCSFFTCHLYEYHFIQENRSWDDAQSYCTEKYTDLATVSNMRDVERLTNPPQTGAWIGLRSINEADIKEWHWSLPGEKYNPTECEPEWGPDEPNNGGNHPKNCVKIKLSQKWHDVRCSHRLNFICYNETGPQKYFLIVDPKYWLQAQSHCRKHHTDLVSGLTEIRSEEFKSITKEFNHDHLWIGLFRDTWSWSDGKNVSFRHWDPVLFKDEALKTCAMTTENGKWNSDKCTVKKPFYCYDDKVILINESKTWDEALDYCRANHSDLVSITDSHQQRWVEKRAKMADTEFVWLGMRYTCTLDLWFWVIDRLVCYHNWAQQEKTEGCDRATAMERDGKWYKKADNEKFNFICVK